jgi:hypothetical protein
MLIPIHTFFFGNNIKCLIFYGKIKISSLSHTRKQPTCVEDTGKLRACWPLPLLPLGCITVAGFCTVTVESGDEGKFVEVRDLLMITLPTTSYNEQNTMNKWYVWLPCQTETDHAKPNQGMGY